MTHPEFRGVLFFKSLCTKTDAGRCSTAATSVRLLTNKLEGEMVTVCSAMKAGATSSGYK